MWVKKRDWDKLPEQYGKEGFIAAIFIISALLIMLLAVLTYAYHTKPAKILIEWDSINIEDGTTTTTGVLVAENSSTISGEKAK